jgi:hypothetical protein
VRQIKTHGKLFFPDVFFLPCAMEIRTAKLLFAVRPKYADGDVRQSSFSA